MMFSEIPQTFEFEWKVEDVFLGSESIRPLDSPVFRISFLDQSTWFLRLLPDCIGCELHRCEDHVISEGRTFKVSIQVEIRQFTSGEILKEWSHPEQKIDSETSHLSFDDEHSREQQQEPSPQIETSMVLFLIEDLALRENLSPMLNTLRTPIPSTTDLSLIWSDDFNHPSSFLPSRSCCFSRSEIMQKTVKWTMDKIEQGGQRVLYLEPAIENASALRLSATNESDKLYLGVEKTDCRTEMSALQMVVATADDLEHFKISFRFNEQHTSHYFDTGIQLNSIKEDSFLLNLDIKEVKNRGCHPDKWSRFLTKRQSSVTTPAREIGKDMLKMYRDEIGSDVKLRTDCGRVFCAHRDFLTLRSPKFKSLLQEAKGLNQEDSFSSTQVVFDDPSENAENITQQKANDYKSELKEFKRKENLITQDMTKEQTKPFVEGADASESSNALAPSKPTNYIPADGVVTECSVQDSQQNLDSEIIVLDIMDLDAETLELLLTYLYSASLKELELHTLLKVYEAGYLYQVPALQNLCRGRLERVLGTKSAAMDILGYALKYDDRQLIILSENII